MTANAFGVDHGDAISKGWEESKTTKSERKAVRRKPGFWGGYALGSAGSAYLGGVHGARSAIKAAGGVPTKVHPAPLATGAALAVGGTALMLKSSKDARNKVREAEGRPKVNLAGFAKKPKSGVSKAFAPVSEVKSALQGSRTLRSVRGGYKGVKAGVGQGGLMRQRVGTHVGIAAGHATTVGGAAAAGLGAGAGLRAGQVLSRRKKEQPTVMAKSWQEIAKAEWKTIDQRERAQRQNRKHAAGAQIAGTYAALGGGYAAVRGGKTTQQLERSANDASSAFRMRREVNALTGATKTAQKATPGDFKRGTSAFFRGAGKGRAKAATAAIGGGIALGVGATAGFGARNKYHQRKINERRRNAHLKRVGSTNDD